MSHTVAHVLVVTHGVHVRTHCLVHVLATLLLKQDISQLCNRVFERYPYLELGPGLKLAAPERSRSRETGLREIGRRLLHQRTDG